MKRFFLLAAIISLVISCQCFADDNGAGKMKYCEAVEYIASVVMEGRQLGVKFSTQMSKDKMTSRYDDIVAGAYKTPRVVGHDLQNQIITEYGNNWYGKCLNNVDSFLH